MSTQPDLFAELDPLELVSIPWAARRLGISEATIRKAIHDGDLAAVMPRGVDPRRTGRLGYKIKVSDLRNWFFPERAA